MDRSTGNYFSLFSSFPSPFFFFFDSSISLIIIFLFGSVRYFDCPPRTGLFVQASKVTSLNSDTESVRSLSPPAASSSGGRITAGSRAARYVGMTAAQLTQRPARAASMQSANTAKQAQPQRPASVRTSSVRRSYQQQQSPRAPVQQQQVNGTTTNDGIPSPAMTPTNNHMQEDEFYDEDMLTDTPAPIAMSKSITTDESPQARLERVLGEAIHQAPDQAIMRLQQLQVKVEVLEAENRYLKLENAQNKTAEQILERSVVMRKKGEGADDDQDHYFTVEGHKAIVAEIKQEHETARKTWEQETDTVKSAIKKLETRVSELETEQAALIKERDELQTQVSEARKEKAQMEHKVHELEEKVAMAEANAAAAQASRAMAQSNMTTNFYSQDPEEMRERQMQMEMEMEEVHEKMGSLMEAMRAKDMFLGTLSEQVEMHRNMAEEREREVRRVKADAERHGRERDRLREEIKELESKWEQHQDCLSKEDYEKIKRELNLSKESLARETAIVADYKKRTEGLEQSVDELKRAGMESIELYESSVELHRVDMEAINASLMDERRKVAQLELEREGLRKAGLEAVETYEATIEELRKESSTVADDRERQQAEMQTTIDNLKQQIEELVNARDKSEETEKIKEVWESERKRLMDNAEAHQAALQREKESHEALKREADKWREQIKEAEKATRERQGLEEQVKQLQTNYDEQLTARSKYLDDVRAAVESQKKTEGELRRLAEAKDKTERELTLAQESLARAETTLTEMRKHGADTDILIKERQQHEKDMDMLRQEIEKLEAQNAMLAKQKEQAELNSGSKTGGDASALQAQVQALQAENKQLQDQYDTLSDTHKQVENECMKLMDEIEKLHSEDATPAPAADLGGCSTDADKIERLQSQLSESKRQNERLVVKQNAELRQLKDKQAEDTKAHERQVTSLNRDIAELESLIESKIFKESDLEEALEKERKQSARMRDELSDLRDQVKQLTHKSALTSSSNSTTSSGSHGPRTDDAPYCELCEAPGHDLMSCKAVLPKKNDEARPVSTLRSFLL